MSSPVYRLVPDYPMYRVGDDGSVWSRAQRNGQHKAAVGDVWRLRKATVNTAGYLNLLLYNNHGRKMFRVHLLVLELFRGPRPIGMDGCHEDGNTLNCRLDNLRWDTKASNYADRDRHGTTARGVRHGRAKLTESTVRAIKIEIAAGASQISVARRRLISPITINHIVTGRTWSHVNV